MRKLSTSSVSNTTAMPVKAGTLQHLQLAYQEAVNALARNVIRRDTDTTRAYILFGCVNSGTAGSMNVSAGAIYYAGEVYLVDAFTLTVTQAAVAAITTTFYNVNADPVTFTDGVPRNVHEIRKVTFSNAASGSGLFDFGNMVPTPNVLTTELNTAVPASYTVRFDRDRAVFFSSNGAGAFNITFDFTNAVPGTVVRIKFTLTSAGSLTVSQPSGSTVIKDSGTLASATNANNLLYCMYCGKNSAGNDEVSYILKQF
jgi:hypothetical protein